VRKVERKTHYLVFYNAREGRISKRPKEEKAEEKTHNILVKTTRNNNSPLTQSPNDRRHSDPLRKVQRRHSIRGRFLRKRDRLETQLGGFGTESLCDAGVLRETLLEGEGTGGDVFEGGFEGVDQVLVDREDLVRG
jgi:hypothetical protein